MRLWKARKNSGVIHLWSGPSMNWGCVSLGRGRPPYSSSLGIIRASSAGLIARALTSRNIRCSSDWIKAFLNATLIRVHAW